MATISGTCDGRFKGVQDHARGEPRLWRRARVVDRPRSRRRAPCGLVGRVARRGADTAVGTGHGRERLLHNEDGHQPGHADSGVSRPTGCVRAGAAVLAGVRRGRQGGCRGTAFAVAHLGRLRPGPTGHDRGPLRLGAVNSADGRAGPVVGARYRLGLPRRQLRPFARGGPAPDYRTHPQGLRRGGSRRAARGGLSNRCVSSATRDGSPRLCRRHRCRSTWPPWTLRARRSALSPVRPSTQM